MSEFTASDFNGRNNGLEIPRLDMATQAVTLSGHLSFQAFPYLLSKTITSIMVIYHTVYYLLSGSDFNGHKFNFIKCTVYSKCQKKYKKLNILLILVLKMFKNVETFYQTVQTFQNDHLMYMYEIV